MSNRANDFESPLRSGREALLTPLWAVVAAFGAYFCMYAFRKPFTAASYADLSLFGIGYKTVLVTAQVAGYTISKFIGIKVIAEMTPARRAATLLALIGVAEVALVIFGLVPAPFNWVFLTLNGLPLGMVFGLVLGFLEGRRLTEALTAGLCASFILAGGVVKSIGAWLLTVGVSQFWMPAATGAIFTIPLLFFTWMLSQVPPPNRADVDERCERVPMSRDERWRLFSRYAPGLIAITVMFVLITVVRSVRDDFMPELWKGLGVVAPPQIFAQTEFWVAIGVTLINGLPALLRSNRAAFHLSLLISLAGLALIGATILCWQAGTIDGYWFMVAMGLGLYLPYVAVHTTIFERFIALSREPGNLGFLMYVADAFGYLGYVAVMLLPALLSRQTDIFKLFITLCWVSIAISIVMVVGAWLYFGARTGRAPAPLLETGTVSA